MLLNEVANQTKMSKRAIKFYEEKGLLSIQKDENGYRNYSEEDINILKKISIYRKLGVSINDINKLLNSNDKNIFSKVYNEKMMEKELLDSDLKAIKQFIEDNDLDKVNEQLDYQSVAQAIESLLPGEWGEYFKKHFMPFLNVKVSSLEQRKALQDILDYCDKTNIKIPLIMRFGGKIFGGFLSSSKTASEMISSYNDMSEDEYEKLKKQVLIGVKMKSSFMKYHPVFIAQRKMQKELQAKGYNDIFIPNLKILSPDYAKYKDAMDKVNNRICLDLGLYYDANYNLILKDK